MLSLLILLLAGAGYPTLERRSSRSASLLAIAVSALALTGLLLQQDSELVVVLWRPIELFGAGFILRMDRFIWPYAMLGMAVLLGEQVASVHSRRGLLFGALVLGTLMAGNLLTAVALWAILPLEASLRRFPAGELRIRAQIPAFLAIIPLLAGGAPMADGTGGTDLQIGPLMIALAGMIRLWGLNPEAGVLPILPSLALLARFGDPGGAATGLVLLGAIGALAGTFLNEMIGVYGIAVLALGLAGGERDLILLTAVVVMVLANQANLVARSWSAAGQWAAGASLAGFAIVGGAVGLSAEAGIGIALLAGLMAGVRWRAGGGRAAEARASIADWAAALLPIAVLGTVSVRARLTLTWAGALYALLALAFGLAMARGLLIGDLGDRIAAGGQVLRAGVQSGMKRISHRAGDAIRAVAGLFEGESGVVWMFLLLLIVLVGMQA